jgi:hypothetical protein
VADQIQWIILGVFAVAFLVLTQSRELMRQITRTAEEWHRMKAALKPAGNYQPLDQHSDSPSLTDHSGSGPEVPSDSGEDASAES